VRVEAIKLHNRVRVGLESKNETIYATHIKCYRGVVVTECDVTLQYEDGKPAGSYKCLASDAPQWLRTAIGLGA